MNRYALIQGGIVANVVEQDSGPTIGGQWVNVTGQMIGPGQMYDGATFSNAPVPIPKRRISAYAFKIRMTSAERIAIRAAAVSSTAIADLIDLVDSSPSVDLNLPMVRLGILSLENAGLLAAGRAVQILDTPINVDEAS